MDWIGLLFSLSFFLLIFLTSFEWLTGCYLSFIFV